MITYLLTCFNSEAYDGDTVSSDSDSEKLFDSDDAEQQALKELNMPIELR